MALIIRNSGPLISDGDIRKIEIVIGKCLPADYRLFLTRHNGGHPEPSCFKSSNDTSSFNGSCVHYFYGVGDEAPHCQLLTAFNTLKGRVPAELIPIADDPFGNQICIAIQGEEIGSIYFWDHETEHKPPTFQNTNKLASSIGIFINGFFEQEHALGTVFDQAIEQNNVKKLEQLIKSDANLEQEDEWGRTMIENAAIANAVDVIEYLFDRGANLRNALSLAEDNAKYFSDHRRSVVLLQKLQKTKSPNS